jgi:prophage regulatory protein
MKQRFEPGRDRPWYQQYQPSFAPSWCQLPATGFVRLWQIIGDPTADPPIPPIIPVKKSCWWAGVKSGRFPKPVKLGPRVTAWRVEDILALIDKA